MIWTRAAVALIALIPFVAGCTSRGSTVTTVARPAGAEEDLPSPTRETLPNGLRLIIQDHRAADIVAVYLWVGVGVRHERPDGLGYAHFQEHMLFKGTDKFGPGHVDRAVEGVGGRTNAVTSFDYTTFYIVAPTDQMNTAIELLHDIAFRSTFDPEEIKREREVIFEEARIEADNPKTAIIRCAIGSWGGGTRPSRPVMSSRALRQRRHRRRGRTSTPFVRATLTLPPRDARPYRAVSSGDVAFRTSCSSAS